jgi:ubiquinone/menaquinone biosynthesis C-methylase UbiE
MSRAIRLVALLAFGTIVLTQCRKPWGWPGRFFVWLMGFTHSGLTDWGLTHVSVGRRDAILDIGCGGGRTVHKLASLAAEGHVDGIDYSTASVAAARHTNASAIQAGRVAIAHGSVSHLPFPDRTFDLVTAVETHYYWPDLVADLREVLRVLKPGGRLAIIAEAHRKGALDQLYRVAMPLIGAKYLTADEHRQLLSTAGYGDVTLDDKGRWLCAVATRPVTDVSSPAA